MSKGEKPSFVNVIPVATKYCEFYFMNQLYKVWKVNPASPDKFGTPVPYDAAVHALCKRSPIISVVVSKKGESPILEEDRAKIKQITSMGIVEYKNFNAKPPVVAGDAAAMGKVLESLTKQHEAETARLTTALTESQKSQEALMKRLEELEKKISAPAG